MEDTRLKAFGRLLSIMDELREKCPWDRKQTWESLRPLTVEETYELSDALLGGKPNEVQNELGDLLLHIVFYAKIAQEKEHFSIETVIDGICQKLIDRHPHVFGDQHLETEEAVKQNWEKIKLKEGNRSVLQGVPKSLPSIVKAMRIQEKARGVGFDWENTSQVKKKVDEELHELEQEVAAQSEKTAEELGDVLFALINYARFLKVDPDEALERTNKKFIRRFQYMEEACAKENKKLTEMTLAQMDEYWEQSKHALG